MLGLTAPAIAGRVEYAVMVLSVFLLVANVPSQWFIVRAQGDLDAGGGLFVSLLFLIMTGFLALQLNGRWPDFWAIVGREPLLPLFLFWATLSTLWSHDVAFSVRRAAAMLVATYMGAHFVVRFSQFEIIRILATTFAVVSFLNVAWILALPEYSGPALGQSSDDLFGFDARLTGIYDNANTLGRVTALGVFTMVAALRLDRRRRPVYLAGIGAAATALSLSQSQTSFVVAILTSFLLVAFLVFRARRQLFGAVFVSVVSATMISIGIILMNLEILTGALGRDITLSGRVPLWKHLLPDVPNKLLTGRGFAGYWNGWGSPSHTIWNLVKWKPPHGHQQYLDVALTLGLIGLIIFTALIVRTFVRATRYVRDIDGSFGLWPLVYCCFFQLNAMTESGLIGRDITWFLLVATILLVTSTKREALPAPAQYTMDDHQRVPS